MLIYLYIFGEKVPFNLGVHRPILGLVPSRKEKRVDLLQLTATIVAITGLIAALSALLRELRNWRKPTAAEVEKE